MKHALATYENCGHCAYKAMHSRHGYNMDRFTAEIAYRDRMLAEETTGQDKAAGLEAFNRGYNGR